jgi:DNA-binding CsgD family transcriptional regulator
LEHALDRLSTPVFIVDEHTKLLFSNKEADKVARRCDVVRVRSDRFLRFVSDKDEGAISRHLAECADLSTPPNNLFVKLQLPSERPFVAFVSQVPGDEGLLPRQTSGPQRFLVFLIDPRVEPATNSEALSTALGITSTEAVLALALLNDKSIKDYAEERGVSANTARAQLRSLMAKTETHRQAELVKILSRTLNTLRLSSQ